MTPNLFKLDLDTNEWLMYSYPEDKWFPARINISYGPGYWIQDMGTIEQCLHVRTGLGQYSVYFRGKKITRINRHSRLHVSAATTMALGHNHPAAKFFNLLAEKK